MASLSLDDILFPSGDIDDQERRRLVTLFPTNTSTFHTLLIPTRIFSISTTFASGVPDPQTINIIPVSTALATVIGLSSVSPITVARTKAHLTELIQLVSDTISTTSGTRDGTFLHPQTIHTTSHAEVSVTTVRELIPSTIETSSASENAILAVTVNLHQVGTIIAVSFARDGTNLRNHTVSSTSATTALLVKKANLGSGLITGITGSAGNKSFEVVGTIHTTSATTAILSVKLGSRALVRGSSNITVSYVVRRMSLPAHPSAVSGAFGGTRLRASGISTSSTTHAIGAIKKNLHPSTISTVSNSRFVTKLYPGSILGTSGIGTANLLFHVQLFPKFFFDAPPFPISNSNHTASAASAVMIKRSRLSTVNIIARSGASGGHILPVVNVLGTATIFAALYNPKKMIPNGTIHTTSSIIARPNNRVPYTLSVLGTSNVTKAGITFLLQIFANTISTTSATFSPSIRVGIKLVAHASTTSAAFGTHFISRAELSPTVISSISGSQVTTMPTARLVEITGTLVDATGTALPDQEIDAALDIPSTSSISYDPAFLSVMPLLISTITASDGTWSMELIAPEDLSVPEIGYIFTGLGFTASTGSFAWQSSPLPLTDILDNPAPNPEILATIYGFITDPSGLPKEGVAVSIGVTQEATSNTTDAIVDASTIITTSSDQNGYWTVDLIPTTLLTPSTTLYSVIEGMGTPKLIAFTTSGGNVNTLVVNNPTGNLIPLTSTSVSADLVEDDSGYITPDNTSTLLTNMNNIRSILAKHSGGRWYDIYTWVTMSPSSAETGSMHITGTADAQSGLLTSGTLSAASAIITNNLTLNGKTTTSNTIPTGSTMVYTTQHGRQTLGSLAVFL